MNLKGSRLKSPQSPRIAVLLPCYNEEAAIEATVADPADNPEVMLEKKNREELVRAALNNLSPEHKEVIDLVYYHEKSVEEVAEIVGIPEATVKTRMFYARKKLSELLKEQGIDRGWP